MPDDVTLPTKYAITKVGEDAYEVITIYLDTGMAEWPALFDRPLTLHELLDWLQGTSFPPDTGFRNV